MQTLEHVNICRNYRMEFHVDFQVTVGLACLLREFKIYIFPFTQAVMAQSNLK